MEKRACVFVDGENFRHTICDLFDDFNQTEHLPKQALWAEFFDALVEWTGMAMSWGGAERVRTYWYVVANIDFFPYRFPKLETEPDELARLLSKDGDARSRLSNLSGDARTNYLRTTVEELNRRKRQMTNRFQGWETLQSGISLRHVSVEFRPAGSIRYNLFDRSLGKEKAVDVKLAIDLVQLREIYDVAIIVTGDQDYVPAVEAVKDYGKTVVNVAFETRGGKLLPGGARRLNQVTDTSLQVKHSDIERFLFPSTESK